MKANGRSPCVWRDHVRRRSAGGPGGAEVDQLLLAGLGDHDVRGFDVTVHDAALMDSRERRADADHDLDRPRRRERRPVEEDVVQRLAGHQLHDDEAQPIVETGVIDPDHVGMGQRGAQGRLGLEPADQPFVCGQVRVQDLHGDGTVQRLIDGPVHAGHPALADQARQPITAGEHPAEGDVGGDSSVHANRPSGRRRSPAHPVSYAEAGADECAQRADRRYRQGDDAGARVAPMSAVSRTARNSPRRRRRFLAMRHLFRGGLRPW